MKWIWPKNTTSRWPSAPTCSAPWAENPLGVIRPGAYADLLIYDGNPLEDIAVLTRPEETLKLVMKDGVIYKNELPRP